jgi:cytoskeletal protein CcmA (bactofilin family)
MFRRKKPEGDEPMTEKEPKPEELVAPLVKPPTPLGPAIGPGLTGSGPGPVPNALPGLGMGPVIAPRRVPTLPPRPSPGDFTRPIDPTRAAGLSRPEEMARNASPLRFGEIGRPPEAPRPSEALRPSEAPRQAEPPKPVEPPRPVEAVRPAEPPRPVEPLRAPEPLRASESPRQPESRPEIRVEPKLPEPPRRLPDPPRPLESYQPAMPVPARPEVEVRQLIVGREISLRGEITHCNRLLIEGSVEANLSDCRDVDIAETGLFKGSAAIETAEIRGRFEGTLTVRGRLFIRATGRVTGTIRYGQIEVERGGRIAGDIEAVAEPAGPAEAVARQAG